MSTDGVGETPITSALAVLSLLSGSSFALAVILSVLVCTPESVTSTTIVRNATDPLSSEPTVQFPVPGS